MVLNRLNQERLQGRSLERLPVERFQLTWNHVSGKGSLKFKVLEHVGIEEAGQLFRGMP
jgi:hypothetical protein